MYCRREHYYSKAQQVIGHTEYSSGVLYFSHWMIGSL